MERTDHWARRMPNNSLESLNSLNYHLSFNTEPETDRRANGSTNLLQLAMERLGTVSAGAPHSTELDQSNEPKIPFPISSTADVQHLTQHLLSLAANSATQHGLAPGQPPVVDSDSHTKWGRFAQVSVSPNSLSPTFSTEPPITPLSAGSESNNALSQLASLSHVLSTTSPTAMTAFQNALAQLALLGLSSPSPMSSRDFSELGTEKTASGISADARQAPSTPSAIQTPAQNGFPFPATGLSDCQNQDSNSVSKVIIRQTADADEHFFKALRKLKVDVSPDFNSGSTTKPPTRVVHKPVADSADSRPCPTDTEMAVDEHFKKSLAGFQGGRFNAFKATDFRANKPRPLTLGSTMDSEPEPNSIGKRSEFGLSIRTGDRSRSRSLIRQLSQPDTHWSESEPFNGMGNLSASTTLYSRNGSSNTFQHHSPTQSGTQSADGHAPADAFDDPQSAPKSCPTGSASTPGSASQPNSFKPKKNWLAQYDWNGNQPGVSNASPTSPNYSTSSSNSSSSGNNHISSNSSSRTFDFGSEAHWTNRADNNEPGASESKQLGVNNNNVTATTTVNQESMTKNRRTNPTGGRLPSFQRGLLLGELAEVLPTLQQTGCGEATLKNPISLSTDESGSAQPNQCHSTSSNQDLKEKPTQQLDVIRKDSATSPISCNHGFAIHVNSTKSKPLGTSEGSSPSHGLDSVGSNRSLLLTNPCRSNSSSPSNTNGIGRAEIAPASSITTGFLTGSTYSLDSSLGHSNLSGFETRDLDSGIDVKSISSAIDEHCLTESQLPQTMNHTRPDMVDSAGCLWSLRKRASSEVSPWSTLKRSRSVLTSPLSCNETQLQFSPTSNHESSDAPPTEGFTAVREEPGDMDNYVLDPIAESNRPLTPDANRTIVKNLPKPPELTSPKVVDRCRQPLDCPMPRLYDMYSRPCEPKASSEPSTALSTNSPPAVPYFRSHTENSGLLRLKSDSKLFVLR